MAFSRPRVLLPILHEHFSELDTLWERRELCIHDPLLVSADLAEIEQRAYRNLEGVLLGQAHALELAQSALLAGERGAATAATFVVLNLGLTELSKELIQALPEADPEALHGVRLALRHHELGVLEPVLRELTSADSAVVRACAGDVLSYQRAQPVATIRDLLAEEDDEVRSLALAAIGRWRGEWQEDDLRLQLAHPSPTVRRAALEASARVGLTGLPPLCRDFALGEKEAAVEALEFLGVIGDETDLGLLEESIADPAKSSAALAALGALGLVQGIPVILAALANPLLAHDAAAAFLRITAAEDVKGEPVPAPAELSDEDAEFWDEHVEADPALAAQWWQENKAGFSTTDRWEGGRVAAGWPVDPETTLAARRDAFLRESLARGGLGGEKLEVRAAPFSP